MIVLDITEKNRKNISAFLVCFFFFPHKCFLDTGKDFVASALCLLSFVSGVVRMNNLKWQV